VRAVAEELMQYLIPLIIIVLIVVFVVGIYNGLIGRRNRVDEALAQIQVQLKRRHDLIPNLVEAVKGYMQFEQKVLTDVTNARAAAVSAGAQGIPAQAQAENVLALQEQLTTTENQISFSRQHYNATVLEYNNGIQTFPNSVFAGMFGFAKRDFFEAEPEAADVPKVDLSLSS
jgi:LemA protein